MKPAGTGAAPKPPKGVDEPGSLCTQVLNSFGGCRLNRTWPWFAWKSVGLDREVVSARGRPIRRVRTHRITVAGVRGCDSFGAFGAKSITQEATPIQICHQSWTGRYFPFHSRISVDLSCFTWRPDAHTPHVTIRTRTRSPPLCPCASVPKSASPGPVWKGFPPSCSRSRPRPRHGAPRTRTTGRRSGWVSVWMGV